MRFFQHRVALLPVSVGLAVTLTACSPSPGGDAAAPASEADRVERGRMLVIGGGCHDCHTTKILTPEGPKLDTSQILAGHPENIEITQPYRPEAGSPWVIGVNDTLTAWSGEWGVSFAANLTPDETTGMGIWTEDMFIRALRTGRHMGTSRPILPPMPWEQYGQLSDEDLGAMFAYLQSIPPIRNQVPVPLTPDGRPIEEP